jgi:hypothetical protein
VTDQDDKQQTAYLDRVNADLSSSLRRCHALVDGCRALLASNSNDPDFANDEAEAERDEA